MARMALALAGLGLVGALAGCSGGDGEDFAEQSAEEIVAAAKSDMGDLEAVRVGGSVDTDGQQISLDLQASSEGDCTGTIGIDDGSAELLGVAGETWMRPDEAFWRSFAGENAEAVLGVVGDKWVVVPPDTGSFDQFCDVDDLLDQLLKDDEEDDGSTYSVSGTDDLDGDPVVLIDNDDPDNGSSTGYVLTDDPHYLVKIEKTDGDDTGSVTFSQFDEQFDVEAPDNDEVVDLGTLGT